MKLDAYIRKVFVLFFGTPEIQKNEVRDNSALSTQEVRNMGLTVLFFFVDKVRSKYASILNPQQNVRGKMFLIQKHKNQSCG